MNRGEPAPGILGRICRFFFWALFAYWAAYSLVAPVTNIDSQMYDLSRLSVAMRGGLFNNGLFTSIFQVMWPWTFDAAHLPFLELGWACALPSFCCLAGTCYAVFAMTRARFGPDAAWMAIVGLIALPCLVYQGTSTKNDIPIVFSAATWVYARWRWQREQRGVHIFWMVLALGFMAGAKTTGALYAAILAAWMLWGLRDNRLFALRAVAGLAGALLLFGSIETYVESARVFGHPLGPPEVIRQLRNADGARGAAANFSRYVVGSVYAGPTDSRRASHPQALLLECERSFLSWAGLSNVGYDRRFSDKTLFFFQSGLEEVSGFGPVGTVAMATILAACFLWRPRSAWWRLSAAALGGFLLVSFTVAYGDWGNRYLISWYALGTVAAVCALWERESWLRVRLRWAFAALAVSSAVAAPLLSFNRGPASIVASLRDRENFETCAFPLMGRLRDRLRVLRAETPGNSVYYVACNDSLVLPILEDPQLEAAVVTPPVFIDLASRGLLANGDLVIEDFDTRSPLLSRVEDVSAPDVYSENTVRNQSIYRIEGVPARPPVTR
jgi:hypothetical protein